MSGISEQPFQPRPARQGAWAIAGLYFLESITRAIVSTIIPLTAYDIFGSKESVSLAYTLVACAALCFSFSVPFLIAAFSRRWTYTLGIAMSALCALLLTIGLAPSQVAAMFLRTTGAAVLNVTLALYIMDHIAKGDLTRSEPLRFTVAMLAWGTCPFLGVWMYEAWGVLAPALVSLGAALALLALFWWLRLGERAPFRAARSRPPNPFTSLRRFAAQPRLRLAWLIAFGRSAFWVTFFIYGPILMVEGGYGPKAGGAIVALGNLMLIVNLVAGRLARRFTLRLVLTAAFFASAAMTAVTGIFGTGQALFAGGALVGAAFFAAILDGLGPVPFLRAVRPAERPQMTTVYRTYLDASELIPPMIYFFMFTLFGFPGAFWTLAGGLMMIGALVWAYLPKRL
jgi:hypothetical protein